MLLLMGIIISPIKSGKHDFEKGLASIIPLWDNVLWLYNYSLDSL